MPSHLSLRGSSETIDDMTVESPLPGTFFASSWATLRALLRVRIIAGTIMVLPIWAVWVVVDFVFHVMQGATRPLAGWIMQQYALHPTISLPPFVKLHLTWLQPMLAVLLTLIFLYVLGLLAANTFGKWTLARLERVISLVPVANSVYGASKQIVQIVAGDPDTRSNRIVLVDFPSDRMKCVAFLASVIRDADTGEDLAVLFITTTPNPTTGLVEIVPLREVTQTDMTMDDVLTLFISHGLISPHELPFDIVRPPNAENYRRPVTVYGETKTVEAAQKKPSLPA